MLITTIGNDTINLAANEETPHLSSSNDAKVNYPNVPEAQMHRLIAYVILVAAGDLIFFCSFFNQRFWLFISICSHLLFWDKITSLNCTF